MAVRQTSKQAYLDLIHTGNLHRKTQWILNLLKSHPYGLTRREIEAFTGLRPNQVSGRVRELVKQKRLVEPRKRKCNITKNIVNVVCLPS